MPGTPDQVDLTINVEEKPTGNLLLGAGFSQRRQAVADRLDQAGQRLRLGQLPRHRGQHQQVQPRRWCSARSIPYFTIDGISRAIDLYYRTTQPLNSQGEEYKLVTPGRVDALRRAVQRVRHGVLRHRRRAHRDQAAATSLPNSYFLYREQFGDDQQLGAADHRLGARRPRQRARADRGPLPARQPRVVRRSATRVPARQLQFQQYFPLTRAFTLGVNARARLRQGPGRPAVPDLQELLRRRPGLGARLRAGLARPGRRHRRLHRRQPRGSTSTPSCTCRCPAPATTGRCACSASSTPATSGARTRRSTLRQPARFGRRRPVSWISPVGPLKLSYGTPIRKQPDDRIQRLPVPDRDRLLMKHVRHSLVAARGGAGSLAVQRRRRRS